MMEDMSMTKMTTTSRKRRKKKRLKKKMKPYHHRPNSTLPLAPGKESEAEAGRGRCGWRW